MAAPKQATLCKARGTQWLAFRWSWDNKKASIDRPRDQTISIDATVNRRRHLWWGDNVIRAPSKAVGEALYCAGRCQPGLAKPLSFRSMEHWVIPMPTKATRQVDNEKNQ